MDRGRDQKSDFLVDVINERPVIIMFSRLVESVLYSHYHWVAYMKVKS